MDHANGRGARYCCNHGAYFDLGMRGQDGRRITGVGGVRVGRGETCF